MPVSLRVAKQLKTDDLWELGSIKKISKRHRIIT